MDAFLPATTFDAPVGAGVGLTETGIIGLPCGGFVFCVEVVVGFSGGAFVFGGGAPVFGGTFVFVLVVAGFVAGEGFDAPVAAVTVRAGAFFW